MKIPITNAAIANKNINKYNVSQTAPAKLIFNKYIEKVQ